MGAAMGLPQSLLPSDLLFHAGLDSRAYSRVGQADDGPFASDPYGTNGCRVLVVEDDPGDYHVLRLALERDALPGVETVWADRLETALRHLEQEPFDLVLLDLTLPDAESADALMAVLARGGGVPVLALTAPNDDGRGELAVRLGAQDCLVKGRHDALALACALRNARAYGRAVQQMLQRDRQLRLLTTRWPVLLWTTDRELRFTSCYGAAFFGLDLDPRRLLGRPLSECFPGHGLDCPLRAAHERALAGEAVAFDFDRTGPTFQAHVEPLRAPGGAVLGTVGVALDVSGDRRVAGEFRVARHIQQGLLPRAAPHCRGLQAAGATLPAEATGGDFFDYLNWPDGSIAAVAADVSGHGFGPAILAAETHACLHVLSKTSNDLAAVLSATNRLLCEDVDSELFVTLLMARIDPARRLLWYAGAGHPDGYLFGADGTVKARLSSEGPILGLDPESEFPVTGPLPLAPGDLVVLLTDGVGEAHPEGGELFGVPRVLELVRSHRALPAAAIVEHLCAAVLDHTRSRACHDDLTAVVLKVDAA